MTLIKLFFIFMYIGFFAIGGGLVAATFMQQALVEQYHLISLEKFYSMLAISESTPGPIGINLATYIGCELFGPVGGIITTLGEVLPSIVVIIIIAKLFSNFSEKPLVKSVFLVIRPVTSGMVLVALVQVIAISLLNTSAFPSLQSFFTQLTKAPSQTLNALLNFKSLVLYQLALVILFRTKLHPVVIVLLGAIFGIIFP